MHLVVLALATLLSAPSKSAKSDKSAPTAVVPAKVPSPATSIPTIRPQGPVPADFLGDPTSQVPSLEGRNGKELGVWERGANSSTRRDWNEFWWRALSGRRDLAARGAASFGDPVSRYLERIKDSVLSGQPELRARVRVYACPSPYVNAVMLPDGLVLFNVGLLARMEDESEIAHVLAHEASHLALRHAQDTWWQDRKASGEDRWARTRFQHSREREMEADSLAIHFLLSSGYSTEGIDRAFALLDGSENARGSRPWSAEALRGFPDLAIPDSFWLDPALAIASAPQTEDSDSMHTHPAIPKRRAAAKRMLDGKAREGKVWLVGREEFLLAREVARKTTAATWLESNQPAAALFESWSLLESHPVDPDLRAIFRSALVELAMERSALRRSRVRARRIRIWGAYQTLDHFLNRIDDTRIMSLGLAAALQDSRERPSDSVAPGRVAELRTEWNVAMPRHLEYLQDTARIARSLRPQKAVLDSVRRGLPELLEPFPSLSKVSDTGWKPLEGRRLYLSHIAWGQQPSPKPMGGLEAGQRLVRDRLRQEFSAAGISLAAPDPTTWTRDSLAALLANRVVRGWLDDRHDVRGAARFRPQLPALRSTLRERGADLVMVATVDDGPQPSTFDRSLLPIQASLYGGEWSPANVYVAGAIFDPSDGSVVRVERARVWNSTPDGITDAAKRLARLLTGPR
jgi:hypothetical protein